MTRHLTISLAVLPLLACSLVAGEQASAEPVKITRQTEWVYTSEAPSCDSVPSEPRVVTKAVQQTPEYEVGRPEVPSGATITLFASFLGSQQGHVMFHLNGTCTECEVIDWKDNSVTTVLPKLGLVAPKNAGNQSCPARWPHRQDLPRPLCSPA